MKIFLAGSGYLFSSPEVINNSKPAFVLQSYWYLRNFSRKEELMKYYDSNPEFQQMIEKKRLDDIKQSQQVPAMSASNGAVNAALTIKEKPTTWDDASQRTRDMFRGK